MIDNKQVIEKINLALAELNDRLIERDQIIRLSILALFSKAHMFLIGERGVAKSLTIRLLGNLIEEAKYWELQVGTDTETKQLFGEKRTAENGTVYYEAKNTVLDAHIVFLDEMFKADSRVLNTLLQLMADRYYTTGDGRMIEVPLVSLIGASNEYPTGKLAEPYLDRLLFWYDVKRIQSHENRLKYFNFEFNRTPIDKAIFSLEEIDTINKLALSKVIFPRNLLELINEIIDDLLVQGVKTSDRKYLSSLEAMKVSSYINGREEIDYSELFLLLFTSWHNDIEKRKVEDVIFYKLFKNRTTFEKYNENIKKDIENIESFIKGTLYDFINYRIEFQGDNVADEFQGYIEHIKTAMDNYNKLYQILGLKKEEVQKIYKIEDMVMKNIFLSNFKNTSITHEIEANIEHLETIIKLEYQDLEKWILNNKNILDYKNNATKNKG